MRHRFISLPLLSVAILLIAFAILTYDDATDRQDVLKQYDCEATSIVDSRGCQFIVYEGLQLDVCKKPSFPSHCTLTETKNEQECMELYEHYRSIEAETVPYGDYRFARCWEHHDFFSSSNPEKSYDWFNSEEERCSARYNHTKSLSPSPGVDMLPYEHYRLEICGLEKREE